MNVQVNGVILYYEKQGSGPPLVLLHGNGEDGRIFDRTAEVLAPHYTVYTIDSRCHGQSSRDVPLSYDLMAADVLAFTKALKLEKPVICGFSDGAAGSNSGAGIARCVDRLRRQYHPGRAEVAGASGYGASLPGVPGTADQNDALSAPDLPGYVRAYSGAYTGVVRRPRYDPPGRQPRYCRRHSRRPAARIAP